MTRRMSGLGNWRIGSWIVWRGESCGMSYGCRGIWMQLDAWIELSGSVEGG